MSPDSSNESSRETSATGGVPPFLAVPPVIGALPPSPRPSPVRTILRVLLSLCLGLFLADGVISLVDDSLILFFGLHLLGAIRGMVFLPAMLLAMLVYALMGLTPMIPKRLFLPTTLFNAMAALAAIPLATFFFNWLHHIALGISLCQVLLGLAILWRVQGGLKFRWLPVAESRLNARSFSWLNLCAFLLVNVFILLPATLVYLAVSAAVAVNHFSEGFVALRPGGLTVQVRDYVRSDGKTVRLIPMSHIGESAFYRALSQSFPTNATVLLEGVTDDRNLLTNKITYKRAAASLGLTEQVQEFQPGRGEFVHADVDVGEFTPNTLGFLNIVMLIHARGVTPETVLQLLQYSPPPEIERQLLDDLLRKRNHHLLKEIHARLPEAETILVPWGAAHMPELGRELRKAGFRVDQTQDYTVIGFGAKKK
jgi:hypothetical protein